MANYYGAYTAFINSIANNQSDFMRERIPQGLIEVYRDIFKPHLAELFPSMNAPTIQGQVIGAKKQFEIPYSADLGMMAPFVDRLDELDEYIPGYDDYHYKTRIVGFAGPTIDPLEFKNEFVDGFIADRNQRALAEVSKAFKRREEMELVNFCFGNPTAIAHFSPDLNNVALKRLLRLDAVSGKAITPGMADADPVLTGKSWADDTDGNPVKDLTTIVYKMGDFMGIEQNIVGYIGNKTAYVLDNSKYLMDYEKTHFDVTQSVIGKTIKGVNLKRITGQYYKDNTTINTGRLHNPGLGSPQPDLWTDRNKVPMMRHVAPISTGDGADPFGANYGTATTTTWEWGLFTTGGPVGSRRYARIFEDHDTPTTPYIHSYNDVKTRETKVNLYEAFTPTVEDFGQMVVVERLTEI